MKQMFEYKKLMCVCFFKREVVYIPNRENTRTDTDANNLLIQGT